MEIINPIRNCQKTPLSEVRNVHFDIWRNEIIQRLQSDLRLCSLFAYPKANFETQNKSIALLAIMGDDASGLLYPIQTIAPKEYECLTQVCPQAHLFEREIYEQWGILPLGHPCLKPVRFHQSYNESITSNKSKIGLTNFFSMEGDEVHEVAVGPVHAGIIEPGHFRFQCHGETVYNLEISLGYQHRGIEQQLLKCKDSTRIHCIEAAAGDTSVGHSLAFAQSMEALQDCTVSAYAMTIRGIALELERCANHIGDLGALAGDIGFLPTQAYCGRIRGDFLNMTLLLCGNRFGRNLVAIGGIKHDINLENIKLIINKIKEVTKELKGAVNLLWNSSSVMNRFEETGRISQLQCKDLGIVGTAARACGIAMDVRSDYPFGIYSFSHIPISTCETGDVFARAYIRWLEIERSIEYILDQLTSLPIGPSISDVHTLNPNHLVVSMTEGWRGEICHCVLTNGESKIGYYKIVDPSFHNWTGLAMALRGQQISDFPLCNKSFNLSYCGFDL